MKFKGPGKYGFFLGPEDWVRALLRFQNQWGVPGHPECVCGEEDYGAQYQCAACSS